MREPVDSELHDPLKILYFAPHGHRHNLALLPALRNAASYVGSWNAAMFFTLFASFPLTYMNIY